MAIPAVLGGLLKVGAGTARAGIRGAAKAGARSMIRGVANKGANSKIKDSKIKVGSALVRRDGGGGGRGAIVPMSKSISGSSSSIVSAPKSEKSIAVSKSKSILDVLNQIKSTLDQILEVEKQEKSKLEDTILDFVRNDEREKRDAEQARQERSKKKSKLKPGRESPLIKKAKKAVGGIWEFISNLVKDFLLFKILEWFGDPKNKKNVERIVNFFKWMGGILQKLYKFVIKPLGTLLLAGLIKTIEIAGKVFTGLIRFFSFDWLPDAQKFLTDLANLPMTILGMIPDMIGKLLNFLTFGLFDNMGNFVGNLLSNLNPFNLFGGNNEEDQSEEVKPEQKKPEQSGNIFTNMFDGLFGNKFKDKQKNNKDIPKLEEGGIVGQDTTNSTVSIEPLQNLIKATKLSAIVDDAVKPFLKLILAPFKIIGTAIVGLILRTVSKIPFVGNLLEPIVRMAATTFGVPPQVLGQLSSATKDDLVKPIDKEDLLKDLFNGVRDLNTSIKDSMKDGSNPFAGFMSSMGGVASAVGGFLSNIFTPPAAAATLPPPSVMPSTPGTGPSAPGAEPSTPGPSTSSGGAYGSGLRTGPSERIGGSSSFHIDTKFKSGMTMEQKIQMMDQLSMGYQQQGRIIEFSNRDVQNETYTHDMPYEKKVNILNRAFAAHNLPRGRAIDQGGFNSIDYYIPLIKDSKDTGGRGRFKKSAEQAEILVPTIDGGTLEYHKGGNYGSFVVGVDKNGEVLYKTGHGDTSTSANRGTVQFGQGTPLPSAQIVKQPTNSTGSQMQSVQQESLNLQSSNLFGGNTSTQVLSNTSTQNISESSPGGASLGNTLPSDGLWATFKTNL